MITRLSNVLLGGLLLAGAVLARAETEEHINKQFPIEPGGTLVVDVDFGSIDVRTGAGREVVIDVFRKVRRGSKSDEERFLAERPVTFSRDRKAVTVHSRGKARNRFPWSWRGWHKAEAAYRISVPDRFDVQLKTSGGSISVSDLQGEVNAQTSGGTLRFARLHGPVHAHTSGGSIRMADCEGTLDVRTSGGGIELLGGAGALEGETSGGAVTVKDFRGPVRVKSGGGGLDLQNIAGRIRGSTSGGSISARFATPMSDEVALQTSGGNVTVRVPENAAFDLDASTSGGRVSSDLPVSVRGSAKSSRLKGPVNGGGSPVVLRSSGGSIQIKRL